jgi:hypothetical protein
MLAGKAEVDEAMFFVIRRERGQDGTVLCDVAEARSLVETGSGIMELIRKFLRMTAGKG